ncbi:hypothetical protein JZU68_05135, partial [bacterium]|nr:hypothetical protein [bacterium]
MQLNKYLIILVLSAVLGACSSDDEFTKSIFDTSTTTDVNAANYAFDSWLRESYLVPYNLDFRYRMQDVGSDQDYNLVPASFDNAQKIAKLVKYLWFDVYSTIVSPQFLKENGPRI